MERFKTTHFRILGMFVLIAGLTFTSCKDSSTSAYDEKDMVTSAQSLGDMAATAQPETITITGLIRDFRANGTVGGHPDFQNDAQCCGLETGIVQNTLGSDGKPVYAGGNGANSTSGKTTSNAENFNQWYNDVAGVNQGIAHDFILTLQNNGSYSYSSGSYFPIDGKLYGNQDNSHNYHFTTEIHTTFTYNGGEVFTFRGDDDVWVFINNVLVIDIGGIHGPETRSVNLDNLGLNEGEDYSLDIFQAERRLTGSSFTITTTLQLFSEPVVTNNVYISDNSVDTYDPLFPATEDKNWLSNVCYQDNSFGINANWANPHKAFQVTKDPSPNGAPHPWESNTFDAFWINAVNDMDSPDTKDIDGNAGPGGHNWTRYETQVAGNGEFVVQLVADNCSWVYLADENGNSAELIGYQATSAAGEFGVNLNGDHTLIFIIFDGGGLAGGKFRLETTASFGGTPPPPIATNTAPVANAGGDITKDATGQTTPVTLDGSASYDPDGDGLSYSWTLNGNEVGTTATANVNLEDGEYTLILTVSDGELSDSDEVNVTIVNTVPVADAGPDQTKEATGPTTPITLTGSGSDLDGDALTYSWSNGGGTDATTTVNLGVGEHTFTLTVSDGQSAFDTDDVVITITDKTAPELTVNKVTGIIWPPNHKMVLVATGISASDIVDGTTAVTVTVTSSEATNGKGDGNTDSDWEVVTNPDGTQDVYVRSERSGKGNGRTYTISLSTTDVAGNSSTDGFEVQVVHNQGNGRGR